MHHPSVSHGDGSPFSPHCRTRGTPIVQAAPPPPQKRKEKACYRGEEVLIHCEMLSHSPATDYYTGTDGGRITGDSLITTSDIFNNTRGHDGHGGGGARPSVVENIPSGADGVWDGAAWRYPDTFHLPSVMQTVCVCLSSLCR